MSKLQHWCFWSDTNNLLILCRFNRYIEVFRSNMIEMQNRSRPPPLMNNRRPAPYDRPGYGGGRSGYDGRSRMKGQILSVLHLSGMYKLCSSSTKARFPLPELTGDQHGPSTRLVETRSCQHGPCWRVMETDHPSTWAVNSGRQFR